MTCKQCIAATHTLDLAIDDGMLYRNLAALQTFEDCAELIRMLHVSELVHYGEYPSSAVSRITDDRMATA
jgi:hypothetical protein